MSVMHRKKSTRKETMRVPRSAKPSRRARKRAVMKKTRKKRTTKGKINRKRRTRVLRGRGSQCSRPQVVDAVDAEPMPENLPLPPDTIRVSAMDPHADLPYAVATSPPPLTGNTVTASAPATNGSIPRAINLDKHPSRNTVRGIMNFPEYMVLRVSPKRQQIEHAMKNYVYHPNYYETFGENPRNVDDQLFRLVMGWYSEEGSSPYAVDHLLSALTSPRDEEIGF